MARVLLGTLCVVSAFVLAACLPGESEAPSHPAAKYTSVRLTADLSGLTDDQKQMLRLFIEASEVMDDAFWMQSYGDKNELLSSITDPDLRRSAEINYGPWDRLDGNAPFIEGHEPKPAGANFYPFDMTEYEFEQASAESEERAAALKDLYTVVRRERAGGDLVTVPYREAFADQVRVASEKLAAAAKLAKDPGLKSYLEARSKALVTDDYLPSDLAWMDMKDNAVDVVIGPIETYEDQLFGYKAAFEGYVLVKDMQWSERLSRYAVMLPDLQRGLPVPDAYKTETPGTDSDLNAYDVIYYAETATRGSKTIAINLPNDERVQLAKGTRRLQLKNAMKAKFDEILLPIAGELIAEDQRRHVTFDAFFGNTMFHEVAHGLGIKNVLDGSGTVRESLKEQASAVEEGKADVLGLYMVTSLHDDDELESALEDHYVTFLASVFRSIRFGASSAHGKANLARFNFFREMGAFSRDEASGVYRVDMGRMREAMNALSERLLTLQGDGDYDGVKEFMGRTATVGPELQGDLDRLTRAGIPVDVVFEQGPEVLGL